MTRRTPQIPALRTFLLDESRKGRALGRLALLLLLLLTLTGTARAQSGRTFYIDYASGSNSNAGTKASPWKSHPFMQTAAGCTGGVTGWGGYSHQAGDHFIFKGGVTWPATCLALVITQGGSSASSVSGAGQAPTINGADYYGVDVTWYTGASFTRPLFDSAGTQPAGPDFGAIIVDNGSNYVTFDDIETARNKLTGGTPTGCSMDLTGPTGITVDRMYIHDWTMVSPELNADHGSGSICNANGKLVNIYNTEISDAATTAPHPFGSCFYLSNEVAYNNCHDTAEGGLFTHGAFHDNEITNLDGNVAYSGACGSSCVHSNAYESDDGPAPALYNNYFYNDDVGFNVICPGTAFYNNVLSKVYNSGAGSGSEINIDDNCAFSTATTQTYVYNNTIDTTQAGGSYGCINIVLRSSGVTSTGVVTLKNNFCIGNGINTSGATQPPVLSNNPNISSSTATTQGYTPGNKYAPISGTGATVNAGLNFTPSCSGVLARFAKDATGTPWFGGSSKTRPTGSAAWDAGAYQFQGSGGGGPPTISISAPTTGATVSGTISLTASCTPQGTATVGSIQFPIDGTASARPERRLPTR